VGGEEGLSLSLHHPQPGIWHRPGHSGLLQQPGSPAVPCPVCQQELPPVTCHPRRDPDRWQGSPALQPGREALHRPWVCPAQPANMALQSSVPVGWHVCRARGNLSAAPLLTAGKMASVFIQAPARGCGCGRCVLVPGVCTVTVPG